jgi:hypothetical protein
MSMTVASAFVFEDGVELSADGRGRHDLRGGHASFQHVEQRVIAPYRRALSRERAGVAQGLTVRTGHDDQHALAKGCTRQAFLRGLVRRQAERNQRRGAVTKIFYHMLGRVAQAAFEAQPGHGADCREHVHGEAGRLAGRVAKGHGCGAREH